MRKFIWISIAFLLLPIKSQASPKYYIECDSIAEEEMTIEFTGKINRKIINAKLTGDIETEPKDIYFVRHHGISKEYLPKDIENYNIYEVLQDLNYWTIPILPKDLRGHKDVFTGYLYVMQDEFFTPSLITLICGVKSVK